MIPGHQVEPVAIDPFGNPAGSEQQPLGQSDHADNQYISNNDADDIGLDIGQLIVHTQANTDKQAGKFPRIQLNGPVANDAEYCKQTQCKFELNRYLA